MRSAVSEERRRLRIALLGTRGVPARYGGFETAVEEVGRRLAAAGHAVTVYARGRAARESYLGMEVIRLPSLRLKAFETLTHTAFSVAHALTRRYDAALVFNAANAPHALALKLRGVPYAIHVDGLESTRLKWGRLGRRYYLLSELLAARTADTLVADARAIQQYYAERYGADSVYLTYGASTGPCVSPARVREVGVAPGRYHLVVARLEPENFVDESVAGFVRSTASDPLVVVGDAPYAEAYVQHVREAAGGDPRVRFVGSVWDQELLQELYANCRSYLHGHSVGGTNPSLVRAMGAGATVLARDVVFNREVLGGEGRFFGSADELAELLDWVERCPEQAADLGSRARERVRAHYDWDAVAGGYADLCRSLANGCARRAGGGRSLPMPAENRR